MSALITPNGISYLGIDSTSDLTAYAPQLQAAGVGFVIRCYAPAGSTVSSLDLSEAQALSAADIGIVAAWYSSDATTAGYFTQQQGYIDGLAAMTAAQSIGQPQSSTIYFSVNYEPAVADITAHIIPYFKGVQAALSPEGMLMYNVGVCGPEIVCYTFQQANAGFSTWLAKSSGISSNSQNYTIVQSSWQLCYPGTGQQDQFALSCNADTSPNILADAFNI